MAEKKTAKKKMPAKPAARKTKKEKAAEVISEPVEEKKPEPAEEKILGLDEIIKTDRYFEADGRRKTSVARVRLWTKGGSEFIVNDKTFEKYFTTVRLQKTVLSPLEVMNCLNKFKISVLVSGGGITGQAEAVRHGLARVLTMLNPNFRKRLKKAGFLKRDSRMRERKKFGLKRARRAPQWAKR